MYTKITASNIFKYYIFDDATSFRDIMNIEGNNYTVQLNKNLHGKGINLDEIFTDIKFLDDYNKHYD